MKKDAELYANKLMSLSLNTKQLFKDKVTIANEIIQCRDSGNLNLNINLTKFMPDHAYYIRANKDSVNNFYYICTLLMLARRHGMKNRVAVFIDKANKVGILRPNMWSWLNNDLFWLILSMLKPTDWIKNDEDKTKKGKLTFKQPQWAKNVIESYKNYTKGLRDAKECELKLTSFMKEENNLTQRLKIVREKITELESKTKQKDELIANLDKGFSVEMTNIINVKNGITKPRKPKNVAINVNSNNVKIIKKRPRVDSQFNNEKEAVKEPKVVEECVEVKKEI
jgi:hypothetical protein